MTRLTPLEQIKVLELFKVEIGQTLMLEHYRFKNQKHLDDMVLQVEQ